MHLTGCTTVVTGAARGIGRAMALRFAREGSNLALIDLRVEDLGETQSLAQDLGVEARTYAANVADEQAVCAVMERIVADFGRIDVLVNNAGINPHYGSIEKTSLEDWNQILAVNLTGVFRCCKLLGSLMTDKRAGSIINISSIAGHVGLKRQAPYGAAKGGVEQFTKSLAHDWAQHGVRVNAIAYGYVTTDLTAGVLSHEHIGPRLLARIPMGRFARLEEVAGAAVFLAADASSYVTGHSLLVDGGWTAT